MTKEELNQKIAEVSKTIYRYCIARTPTREEAEDLSQDILYELVKSAGNIRDDTAFYAFMWGVAGNVYKQWCRKRAKMQVSELTDDIPAEPDSCSFDNDGEADIYRLRRELALLSERHRHATVLYCTTSTANPVPRSRSVCPSAKAWSSTSFSNPESY